MTYKLQHVPRGVAQISQIKTFYFDFWDFVEERLMTIVFDRNM